MKRLFLILNLLVVINAIMKVATTPPKFSETNEQCSGKHEIPLKNLLDYGIRGEINDRLVLTNFDVVPFETILGNDGKTIILTLKYNTSVPTINFGISSGLDTYRFQFLYFQWCNKSSKSYPAELHAVFYNTKEKNFEKALYRKNSIVVFAYKLEISPSAKTSYAAVLKKSLKNVRTGFNKVSIENLPLKSWMADYLHNYILYEGSLTYFNCDTQVLWVDFLYGLKIEPALLNEFKLLQTYEGAALMEQYKPFLAPSGPIVINFGYSMKDLTTGLIPLVNVYYPDDDDTDRPSSGCFQIRKQLKQVGVLMVFFEIYLMFY